MSRDSVRIGLVLGMLGVITGCGGDVHSFTAPPVVAATPTGNWLITGDRTQSQYPVLSVAVIVNGGVATLYGDLQAKCANSTLQSEEEGFYVTASIDSNGNFLAVTQQTDIPITIQGGVPSSTALSWTGTYSIGSGKSCTVNKTGQFTAGVLPLYDGTYSGTLPANGAQTHPAQIGATISFSQAAATSVVNSLGTFYYLPLASTMNISGLTCFASGSSIADLSTNVYGEAFGGTELMNDGSKFLYFGTFADAAGSSINISMQVAGGNCDGFTYIGTLQKQ